MYSDRFLPPIQNADVAISGSFAPCSKPLEGQYNLAWQTIVRSLIKLLDLTVDGVEFSVLKVNMTTECLLWSVTLAGAQQQSGG
jgi:hypothetical protein